MTRPAFLAASLGLAASVALTACDPPGKPPLSKKWQAPAEVTDFTKLYQQNCLGCHSLGETYAPSTSMANPYFLASISREQLVDIIANGVPGSRMPAFADRNGGPLTDEQVGIIADGILAKRQPVEGPVPAYSAPLGDAAAGQTVYTDYVAALEKILSPRVMANGFLANRDFLGVVTDQYLRTLIIGGAVELGIPSYREAIPGRVLSDAEIADLVAYLSSQRRTEYGQPTTSTNP